jgi:tetratricopeptide (TPR) repeat protein
MVDALYHAGNLSYNKKNYSDANIFYQSLEKINTDELKILVMNKGLMLTYYNLKNHENAIIYSGKVLAERSISNSLKERAYMIKANSNFELGKMIEAEISYEKVILISTDIDKAIAKFRTCEITFGGGDYKKTEKKLFEFLKQKPSYDYWLAKGYILLADCYVEMDDNFQAKATLQSVIDNYKADDEIIETCKTKLEAIKVAEEMKDNGEEEEVEIELGE